MRVVELLLYYSGFPLHKLHSAEKRADSMLRRGGEGGRGVGFIIERGMER